MPRRAKTLRSGTSGGKRVKIVALLSWYDEHPSWLSGTIASLAPFTDHIVCVDGAYRLFPEGKPSSGSSQHEAIVEVCYASKIGLTLHVPQTVWLGNEREKRAFMFDLGRTVARTREDWFFAIDSDELVTEAPQDLRKRLSETSYDVAQVGLWRRPPHPEPRFSWPTEETPSRQFFRALPGLTLEHDHYTYTTEDGKVLRGRGETPEVEDLSDLKVEHRLGRDLNRLERQRAYYSLRDELGVEVG
jgi:hypothetical protein